MSHATGGILTVPVIVLTGGPCAGKTTVLSEIQKAYSDRCFFIPEVATMLLDDGYPCPGKDGLEWSREWQIGFQQDIYWKQLDLEYSFGLSAHSARRKLVVCDRGLLDSASYLEGGMQEFCELFRLSPEDVYQRYAAVIHLESVATGCPDTYGRANNGSRFEERNRAVILEQRLREAWQNHPQYHFVDCSNGVEGKTQRVLEILKRLLE
jgi:predicted ATPase